MSEASVTSAPMTGGATAGEMLRQAREQQGLHIAALATAIKVTPKKLELIESDRYSELPDPAFTRSLALSMCRALKIDHEPVLAKLPRTEVKGLEHVARGLGQPFRDQGSGGGDGGAGFSWLSLPLIAALVLVIGAVVVYLLPAGRWSLPSFGESASAPTATGEPNVVVESIIPPGGVLPSDAGATPSAAPATEPSAAASGPTETVFGAPDAAASAAAAAPTPTPAVAASLLTLTASADSWVEVRDGAGKVLLSRTLRAGESAGVDGNLPMRLVVGNLQGVKATLRGEPLALTSTRGDNVARMELR